MQEGMIGAVADYATIEVSNQMFDALLAADDALSNYYCWGAGLAPGVLLPGRSRSWSSARPRRCPANTATAP